MLNAAVRDGFQPLIAALAWLMDGALEVAKQAGQAALCSAPSSAKILLLSGKFPLSFLSLSVDSVQLKSVWKGTGGPIVYRLCGLHGTWANVVGISFHWPQAME